MTHFTDLGLNASLLKALAEKGYDTPTPIQIAAIPGVAAGRDLLGIAQTGTGKTAAFALPILHRLAADRRPAPRKGARCLVLSPTRELATQIAESFRSYGAHMGFTVATVFGGVGHGPQIKALARGVDILVAAPGRLLDHLAQKDADLSAVEIFVLDEADQMLDMGFIVPIRKIVKHLSPKRQNLFFSATMPADIGKLAGELLHDPLKVSVAPQATTAERVNQQVVMVDAGAKRGLLVELFRNPEFKRVLVFTRTKRGADKVARVLEGAGVQASAIHGNKSQNQRERALADFKAGDVRALVATDIAARGIDVSAVSHVVQYELPDVPEQYVHRIGRTARAGAGGSAVAFCAADERDLLRDIEKVTRQKIPSVDRRGDADLARIAAETPEAKGPSVEARGEPGRRRGGQQKPRGDGRPQQRRPDSRSGPRSDNRNEPRSETRNDQRPQQANAPRNAQGLGQQGLGQTAGRNGDRLSAGPFGGPDEGKSRRGRLGGQNNGGQNGNQNRNDPNRNEGQNRNAGKGGQTRNGQPAHNGPAKPHRKGSSSNKPNQAVQGAPRGDLMKVAGASTGPATPAADVMRFLNKGLH